MRIRLVAQSTIMLFLIFISSAGLSFAKQPADDRSSPQPLSKEDIFDELELFADAVTLINANYVEEIKPRQMIYGALDGMLSSLDSHSGFLDPDEYKEIQEETKGEFGGLGVKVTMRDKILTVVSPLEGTPADKAGILPGDKIIGIDGVSTKDLTLDDAVKRLRGTPGTEVKLTILREDEKRLEEFLLRRAVIRVKSVKDALILDEDMGYIRITDFQRHTSVDLERAVRQLLKRQMQGLILDLRNNPGGLLDAAVSVSEKFIKRGNIIVSTEGRIKEQEVLFKSKTFKAYEDFPIAVLVNRGSASASEIVAAALRDNMRAVIVGEKTFGKGSVQTVIPMKDGSALRLTTSLYYTPSGEVIHDKGIVPDIEIEFKRPKAHEESKGIEPEKRTLIDRLKEDVHVQAALELLKDRERYMEVSGRTSEIDNDL